MRFVAQRRRSATATASDARPHPQCDRLLPHVMLLCLRAAGSRLLFILALLLLLLLVGVLLLLPLLLLLVVLVLLFVNDRVEFEFFECGHATAQRFQRSGGA